MYDLAMMYCNGIAVEKNRSLSLQYIQQLCDRGCTKAETTIGFWYRHGFIVDRDFSKSLEYYKKAADKGHPGAQNDIANMYEEGYGVEPNIDLAVYYYKLASDQGHTAAMYNLGTMYESGVGVKMDKTMALKFYQSSADEGDPDASWAAGTFYENGQSRVRNYKLATKYFYMATRTPEVQASKNAAQRLKQVLSGHKTDQYRLEAIEVLYVDSWPNAFKVLNPFCKEAILAMWCLFGKSLLRDLLVLLTKKMILLWPGEHAQEFINEPF
jgi:TPR repeat protein